MLARSCTHLPTHAAASHALRPSVNPPSQAHRLKNDQTLTNRALAAIDCRRRVLLSGTPMQNHLDEVRRRRTGRLSVSICL